MCLDTMRWKSDKPLMVTRRAWKVLAEIDGKLATPFSMYRRATPVSEWTKTGQKFNLCNWRGNATYPVGFHVLVVGQFN